LQETSRVSPYGRSPARRLTFPLRIEPKKKGDTLLLTIAIILIVLWLLGLISSYTLGGWIHLLLIAAIIAFVVQLLSGPRAGPPPPV